MFRLRQPRPRSAAIPAAPAAPGRRTLLDGRLERSAADHVRRHGRHDREADLLGYIFSRSDHRSLPTQPAPAVAQDQRVDLPEQSITGQDVARNGRLIQIVDRQLLGSSLFGRTGIESSCFWSRIGAQGRRSCGHERYDAIGPVFIFRHWVPLPVPRNRPPTVIGQSRPMGGSCEILATCRHRDRPSGHLLTIIESTTAMHSCAC